MIHQIHGLVTALCWHVVVCDGEWSKDRFVAAVSAEGLEDMRETRSRGIATHDDDGLLALRVLAGCDVEGCTLLFHVPNLRRENGFLNLLPGLTQRRPDGGKMSRSLLVCLGQGKRHHCSVAACEV